MLVTNQPSASRLRTPKNANAQPADDALIARTIDESSTDRGAFLLAVGLSLLIIVWTALTLLVEEAHFAVLAPTAEVGVEAASAFARLFGAFVLSLLPNNTVGLRLRWVAGGFLILGLGGLGFGFLKPMLLGGVSDLNTSAHESLLVQTLACMMFVIGLVTTKTPHISLQHIFGILVALICVGIGLQYGAAQLPSLVRGESLSAALVFNEAPSRWLTGWHWSLSLPAFGLSILAVVGAVRHSSSSTTGRWLVIAMTLFAGAQLHTLFWPLTYSPVLTTADLLRLASAAVLAIGGSFELRRIAAERAALLVVEQEHSHRLRELAVLKADFTAMVAHELGSPLAAIRGFCDMLDTGALNPAEQTQAVAAIRTEAEALTALVSDVRNAANVERADFTIDRRPVAINALLNEAATFATTLPGHHTLTLQCIDDVQVCVDRERIGQVLRNLLSNAAKYSHPGAPIELRAWMRPGVVRIEVTDHGPGIHPEDRARIFEKFGRGRDCTGRNVAGVGLGLYLSRRIVQAHGSALEVTSTVDVGSVFAFELEVVS